MSSQHTPLRELAALFFRLGATAFGGPAAHIAMMQDEVVERRRWMTEERFLDLVGATNLIPGPNSTELAIHIGWDRRGFPGLLVAGASFIVPAMLLAGALGWAYRDYGTVPSALWLLYGVKPVMIAVVAQAVWTLAPKAAATRFLRIVGVCCGGAAILGVHELLVLLAAGLVAVGPRIGKRDGTALTGLVAGPSIAASTVVAAGPTLSSLFLVFLKTGSVLFGSGYVLLAFLRRDLVERLHWLTEAQLVDAIAAGQVTPGPVFTTATFIGYFLAGPGGALAATAGIFLPAFVFVALSGPLVPRIRGSRAAGAFLDGVNVASLALMTVVGIELARAAVVDVPAAAIALGAGVLLVRFRVNSTWLVLGGALLGWIARAVL